MIGRFITFEGPDGAGKTSVLTALVPRLKALAQVPLIETREPGGNPISEAIRQIILDPKNTAMDPRTEALLYTAARRQHIIEKIRPALAANKLVLCDRFVDSSLAYQGAGREIGVAEVAQMNLFATEALQPDLTLYLDVPSEVGLARISAHRPDQNDRLDQEALSFHQKVRGEYLQLAKDNPQRIKVIDATQAIEQVIAACQTLVTASFPEMFRG
ncbi:MULTISPECIES: dTMP kinase [Loigolactobacillus]|uniref:Thymidylate kinase n=1 Tax=Loigolactobacillus backii TaxID=375175 RepID=A0A192H2N4_9LACO|nr:MULTISPECIES: dTMP kinase [Loigolactobacillus]ANK59112.1 dTMP kinase [Loigolactobacillus backii]ANK62492.1 dTMP kinase [Loigolactobacillus backii]ANK64101.1 dTMP kinase [Loigolactobacillus backii]ANK67505.1 dTMP kinase [Loigolactobacillus backii]ANK70496.1 dTMP kinase [Loigolactobacillus backii]